MLAADEASWHCHSVKEGQIHCTVHRAVWWLQVLIAGSGPGKGGATGCIEAQEDT